MNDNVYSLKPYKNDPSFFGINVSIKDLPDKIIVHFKLNPVTHLNLGPLEKSQRRTLKLWEKTCLEFFIKNAKGEYYEFNIAPNLDWNCFYFPSKGSPLVEHPMNEPLEFKAHSNSDMFELEVTAGKKNFHTLFWQANQMSVGISSVIENKDGQISYWALEHCDSRPNFHHFDSFVVKL